MSIFRGRVEGLEKCSQDFVCIFAGFVRMAFDEFGKAVFWEDFGVFGKKAEEQAGQEDIEGMDVFGFFKMVGAADMVEKAPHFFGSFGVGGIFFKSAAFFQACEGKEKAVVLRQVSVGAFEVVVGLAIVGGDVLKIGYDKEADFVFVGGGGLFQVLQDVVYV